MRLDETEKLARELQPFQVLWRAFLPIEGRRNLAMLAMKARLIAKASELLSSRSSSSMLNAPRITFRMPCPPCPKSSQKVLTFLLKFSKFSIVFLSRYR